MFILISLLFEPLVAATSGRGPLIRGSNLPNQGVLFSVPGTQNIFGLEYLTENAWRPT